MTPLSYYQASSAIDVSVTYTRSDLRTNLRVNVYHNIMKSFKTVVSRLS